MNLRELETFAKLPAQCRTDVERYCSNRGYAYSAILSAHRHDIWAMGKVHGLIVHLARRGHRLKQIHTAAGVEQDYALRVIQEAKKEETRIPTVNYERLALCRR